MDGFDALMDLSLPQVSQKDWMKQVDLRLATADDLDEIARECIEAGVFGLDLETTGLDQRSFEASGPGRRQTMDKDVGYCLDLSKAKG